MLRDQQPRRSSIQALFGFSGCEMSECSRGRWDLPLISLTGVARSHMYVEAVPLPIVELSRISRSTKHIIGHIGDDFTGRMTQPTVSSTEGQ